MKKSWNKRQKSVIVLLIVILIGIILYDFSDSMGFVPDGTGDSREEHDCGAQEEECVQNCLENYELGSVDFQECVHACGMAHDECAETTIPSGGTGITDQTIIDLEVNRADCIDAGGTYCPVRGCDSGFEGDDSCGGIRNCCVGPCRSPGGDRPQWLIECMIRLSSQRFGDLPFGGSPPGLQPRGGPGPGDKPTCNPIEDSKPKKRPTEEDWLRWELACILMFRF